MEHWKKVAWSDESLYVLDQLDGWVCVVYLGKIWQQNALWEEGRQTDAVLWPRQCSAGKLWVLYSCECYFDT